MNWAKLAAWPRRYLWQAPRGAVLKHTRNSDKILNTHIAGKSIAVVGNAQSLFDAEFGTEIDAHDIVIRLNKGFVKSPLAQGHRTDFWGFTPELSEAEMQDHFDPKVILFLIPKLRHLRIYRPQNVAKLLFYARQVLAARSQFNRAAPLIRFHGDQLSVAFRRGKINYPLWF
jgi:hypothetical protein